MGCCYSKQEPETEEEYSEQEPLIQQQIMTTFDKLVDINSYMIDSPIEQAWKQENYKRNLEPLSYTTFQFKNSIGGSGGILRMEIQRVSGIVFQMDRVDVVVNKVVL